MLGLKVFCKRVQALGSLNVNSLVVATNFTVQHTFELRIALLLVNAIVIINLFVIQVRMPSRHGQRVICFLNLKSQGILNVIMLPFHFVLSAILLCTSHHPLFVLFGLHKFNCQSCLVLVLEKLNFGFVNNLFYGRMQRFYRADLFKLNVLGQIIWLVVSAGIIHVVEDFISKLCLLLIVSYWYMFYRASVWCVVHSMANSLLRQTGIVVLSLRAVVQRQPLV